MTGYEIEETESKNYTAVSVVESDSGKIIFQFRKRKDEDVPSAISGAAEEVIETLTDAT